MQPVSSRIWNRVAVSISDDDNHYTITPYINKNKNENKNKQTYKQTNWK